MFYFTFRIEITARETYAMEAGAPAAAQELQWRRPALWRSLGEAAVAAVVLWHACSLVAFWVDLYHGGEG